MPEDNSSFLFETTMNSAEIKLMIETFSRQEYNCKTVNTVVADFNNILIKAADLSLKKKKACHASKKRIHFETTMV